MKELHEEASSPSPSPWTLGFCLLFAVSMCSSAGVVFDILTTTKGTPPFLAAFWRLLVQNIVQFVPFAISLWKYWRQDKEKAIDYEKRLDAEQRQGNTNTNADTDSTGEEERLIRSSSSSSQSHSHSQLLLPRYISSLPLCAVSGFFLGVHFSMWVYSMRYTSLTHSLLWVSMGPIIINGSTWFLYMMKCIIYGTWTCAAVSVCAGSGFLSQCGRRLLPSPQFLLHVQKPTALETFGAIFGIFGAMVMLLGVRRVREDEDDAVPGPVHHSIDFSVAAENDNDGDIAQTHPHEPTIYGDVAAFSGAVAVCVYLVIGRNVRSFLPIWLYVFPVIGFASLTCLLFFMCDYYAIRIPDLAASENEHGYGYEHIQLQLLPSIWDNILGFMDLSILPYVIYLGVGPGICGHTLINTLLKYVSPLIVSTAMLAEPILGSIIGYMVGLQPLPGVYTWIGGSVLMVGLVLVVVGENENSDGNDQDKEVEDGGSQIRTAYTNDGRTYGQSHNQMSNEVTRSIDADQIVGGSTFARPSSDESEATGLYSYSEDVETNCNKNSNCDIRTIGEDERSHIHTADETQNQNGSNNEMENSNDEGCDNYGSFNDV